MSAGKIQYAESDGSFILKFIGDVRLTLCSALDKTLESILQHPGIRSVIIDLTETQGIDSTSLGLLAKLSIQSKKHFGFVPTILSTSDDINRILMTMGFDQVFVIVRESKAGEGVELLKDLPCEECGEDEVMDKVLSAHKTLMELNEHNRQAFHDLVRKLENDDES
ncbi:STAS domain-containing protein [Sansalvadorimonas sp. 2012CJ34-2]|uniref:STAS domain-containing protein n=1 Tax=Parendozoicomonas callyspongiae TaxID=2942213 RepID=A0ABT0PL46_9GAMM|nr:STAS domain-containing protein [Sansalvadorimonas sp. 2012CJ34-2]MCL6272104.1 STAS domain-containing protein [Sansalvadorimonas sp. 2012CJ34-2]